MLFAAYVSTIGCSLLLFLMLFNSYLSANGYYNCSRYISNLVIKQAEVIVLAEEEEERKRKNGGRTGVVSTVNGNQINGSASTWRRHCVIL